MNYNTYILPTHYASALVNGDRSGLSDEEEKELDTWLDKVKPGYCLMISDGDPWFQWGHDMNRSQGATVCEYYFDKR